MKIIVGLILSLFSQITLAEATVHRVTTNQREIVDIMNGLADGLKDGTIRPTVGFGVDFGAMSVSGYRVIKIKFFTDPQWPEGKSRCVAQVTFSSSKNSNDIEDVYFSRKLDQYGKLVPSLGTTFDVPGNCLPKIK